MYLHGTSRINARGHLEIGGCDTVELAQRYGTPLYIMDEALIREKMRAFVDAFQDTGLAFRVAYASKAFSTLAMCRIVDEEGLMLDVVSEGELYTALSAGFPAERIYFHGNNKTPQELEFALDEGIYLFVVDNFDELMLLEHIAKEKEKRARIILRITPGVEAYTHKYIQTGKEDSKFGFGLDSGQALEGVRQALECTHLDLMGFHCHIGSQIFETEAFQLTIAKMGQFIKTCYERYGLVTRIFNTGGGFGIRYHKDDAPKEARDYVQAIAEAVRKYLHDLPVLPEIWIEPGRYIVGEAGTTLYTIGAIKEVPGIRKYVSIDGGMSDNLRPALYQAKYEAMLANRAQESATETVTIAGKACEEGDILIWDLKLPQVKQGDILAVNCTGAYNFSMANNYNRVRRPAVLFVKDGQAEVVVERETLQDVIARDRIPARLAPKKASVTVG
ncbi:diaminopimelate decarboxylase [Thermoflavimicrobium dichotomicum]|uniref:Diaminopimelate decarboxylase n=1 Tax=Thermoflavimicrobium dichotomicum TaxID=46223 RepID=A0A1I3V7L5_9BACL|nr:diaminopimelate decarboxylase [Thermoflavimicrobium dichotomicum]SFJ90197.1 diaminopimelate decarboxylase [Thermoflavimicrobium dichotomicum]